MTQTDNSAIVATPLNGHIGAEISNIDLGRPLAQADFDGLQAALARYEVLVFRDQDISLEAQIAFAKRFGNLSTHPFATNLPDVPEVIEFDNSGRNPAGPTDSWHSDETFRARPPMATILRAKVVPPYGGETVFASMTAAYDGLSEPMKVYVHRLRARHDFKPWRHMFADSKAARMKLIELEDEFPNPMHPIVRIHPVTGRRVLFVNPQFTVGIEGLKEDEGQTILNFLYRQAMVPDYQLRLKWRPHTIVMWDNRSTQHYAPHDYYPHRRNMARLTVEGGPVNGPVGAYEPQPEDPLKLAQPPSRDTDETKLLRPFERAMM